MEKIHLFLWKDLPHTMSKLLKKNMTESMWYWSPEIYMVFVVVVCCNPHLRGDGGTLVNQRTNTSLWPRVGREIDCPNLSLI